MIREFQKEGLWCLILGGSTGLGLASAKKLALHGMNICIVHRNSKQEMATIEKSFLELADCDISFLSFNADAINAEKMEMIISTLKEKIGTGKIRCLLHSIAKGNLKAMIDNDLPELQKDDFMITLDNMAISLYSWTKALFVNNLFAKDCRILSFSSEGNKKAYKNYGAVSVAKAAIEAITRNIALEFAPFGIRANCIQAGVTITASQKIIPGSDQMVIDAIAKSPFGRITTTEDVANVVYLLCKDEAAWINGAVIPVDGGESIV